MLPVNISQNNKCKYALQNHLTASMDHWNPEYKKMIVCVIQNCYETNENLCET